MSDICVRLRDMPVSIPLAETTGGYIDIGDEAAYEIERLRRRVDELETFLRGAALQFKAIAGDSQ